MSRLQLGRALWFLGFPDSALERIEAGLALGQRLAHANSLAFALNLAAALHTLRREFDMARERAEAAIHFATANHLAQWLAFGNLCRGFALAALGRHMEGVTQLRAGLAGMHRVGARLLETQWLGYLAEAHFRASQLDDALAALDRATEMAATTGEDYYQAELHRLRGVVLAETGRQGEAAACFRRAIDTARSQQA